MLFHSGEMTAEDVINSAKPKCIMELVTQPRQQSSEMTILQSNDLCPTPKPTAPASQRQIIERVSLSHLESYCSLKTWQLLLFAIRILLLRKWAVSLSKESEVNARKICVCVCVCLWTRTHLGHFYCIHVALLPHIKHKKYHKKHWKSPTIKN